MAQAVEWGTEYVRVYSLGATERLDIDMEPLNVIALRINGDDPPFRMTQAGAAQLATILMRYADRGEL